MLTKPPEILDRSREWALLCELWERKGPQLAFAVGRRRIGKSFVLSRFAKSVDGVYYQATKRAEKEQLAEISRMLGSHFKDAGLEAGLEFPSWEAVFNFITLRADGRPLLLVLDEFPYLVDSVPALPSVIQKYWDHDWQGTGLKIILSGSYVSAMTRLETADQPLYGRRTGKLLFGPFSYKEAGLFTPKHTVTERLIAYGIFGHLPGNLALQDRKKSLAENVARTMLDTSGRLADDAQMLLDAFLGESAVYYGIIEAVATGDHTWKGITSRVGRTGGSLARPLQWLEEMGLIERVVPITEKNPAKSKRSQYRIADPYVRFWHRVVSPVVSAGMVGMVEPRQLWEEWVRPRIDDYMGETFEAACRDFVRHSETLPFSPWRVGEWWNASSTEQIDIVALGSRDELLVGECKWGAVSRPDLEKLRRRLDAVASELSGRPLTTHLALFSGSGEADADIRKAIRSGDVLFFGADDLY